MKKINRLIMLAVLAFLFLAGIGNLYLIKKNLAASGREYRVSLNRVKQAIENYEHVNGEIPENLSQVEAFSGETYKFIRGILSLETQEVLTEQQREFFREEQDDYVIFSTDTCYYKITYETNTGIRLSRRIMLAVNILLGSAFFCCLFLLLYIRQRLLVPLYRLSDVPYELSKGNLTIPLKENKDKVLGRFVWGMDLLRERLEENKARELALQKEKKVLLLSLSHDIKTPLSAIKLYAKALNKNLYSSESKKREVADSISDKVDEIEGYISEIVKASNEDFLVFEVENGEFYAGDALNEIRSYYTDKMELNQIEFRMENCINCLICGDRDRLVEVIQNTVENAIKYGDGKRIWIDTERNEEEYTIHISNTGCMLDNNEALHIFESFYRGTNVGKQPGSGLGLYICRQLMHLMDGEITAEISDSVMTVNITLRLA